ncbi:hypothetical protein [Phyllobacterium sp. YR531]|uniref:hypothetical protein n=1 Tax=Phyllobacterium sp. YR531 TaxID=1144343 RepID=UPI00026FBAC9|nr:hypothetical protein [Phyllobacterium sp. YR531]EJN04237.1 hypothetical protein PMI41_01876 [Phyllobacterium sp. YR531]
MSKFNYDRAQATALRLLDKFGQAGSIVRDMPGNGPIYDPGEPVPTPYPCVAAVLAIELKDVDGTLVKSTDKTAYVASKGLAIEPTTIDRLMFNGKSYTIVKVAPLQPAATIVYHKLFVRS